MKFDCTDYKIFALKVGKTSFFEHCLVVSDDLTAICGIFLIVDIELKKICVEELSWKCEKKI